jgi:hypothetical protein
VGVVVVQARQGRAALQVDDPGAGAGQRHDFGIGADGHEPAVLDRDRAGLRPGAIQRGDAAIMEDDIRCCIGHGGNS